MLRVVVSFAALALLLMGALTRAAAQPPGDGAAFDCRDVLPEAETCRPLAKTPFVEGLDDDGEVIGWAARSTDVVDIQAYSGKPLITLVGIDRRGIIVGAKLLKHSEPILLAGIPEKALHDFIARYHGFAAVARVVVGSGGGKDAINVDVISGATVTALAQNQTILHTARELGMAVGVIDVAAVASGHFVERPTPLTWAELVAQGVIGYLRVSEAQMGGASDAADFIAIWFTMADAPQVGRALIGERLYEQLRAKLEPGQHLFVLYGNGSNSFKGSAFVRGGIFDRVRIAQGLRECVFRDTDYAPLSRPATPDAPDFNEGAVFVCRSAQIDPGTPFDRDSGSHVFQGIGRTMTEERGGDALLLIGDQIYADASAGLFDPVAWRDRYERRYRAMLSDPNVSKVLNSIPTHFAVDDHEFADNYAGVGAPPV